MDDFIRPDNRAGWWRRTLALLADSFCVILPSIAFGALLFAITGGLIQWSKPGLQWQTCISITSIPSGLQPPPPLDSNEGALCKTSSLLGSIGSALVVGRTVREPGQTRTVARSYALRSSGQVGAYDVSWITYASLLALLIAGEWRSGTTPGKRLFGIRVVASDDPMRRSVPLPRIATRYAVAIAGVGLPLGLALALSLIPVALGGTPAPFALMISAFLIVLASVWQIWNLARIVRRRPAIYDYAARLDVVRTMAPIQAASMTPGRVPP